jgi:hypothetical protein
MHEHLINLKNQLFFYNVYLKNIIIVIIFVMKKIVPALVIAICFFSCKKNAAEIDTSSYYIKAMFNGSEEKFSDNAEATNFSGDITADFIMTAKNNISNNAVTLVIEHAFDTTVTKGIYEPDLNNHYFNPGGNYVKSDTLIYSSGVVSGPSKIKITILNLTSLTVGGTFSGVFKNTNNINDSISITDGEFNLPVH